MSWCKRCEASRFVTPGEPAREDERQDIIAVDFADGEVGMDGDTMCPRDVGLQTDGHDVCG